MNVGHEKKHPHSGFNAENLKTKHTELMTKDARNRKKFPLEHDLFLDVF